MHARSLHALPVRFTSANLPLTADLKTALMSSALELAPSTQAKPKGVVLAAQPIVSETLSLEGVFEDLLEALRRATTLVDVNVAAGIAHEGIQLLRSF